MSNMYQTITLPIESVRITLVQQFIQIANRMPNREERDGIEEVVKYIFQSK